MKPQPQLLGQLPIERVTPGPVFDKVGVDYAGPVLIKYGHVRKPTVVKAYICVLCPSPSRLSTLSWLAISLLMPSLPVPTIYISPWSSFPHME